MICHLLKLLLHALLRLFEGLLYLSLLKLKLLLWICHYFLQSLFCGCPCLSKHLRCLLLIMLHLIGQFLCCLFSCFQFYLGISILPQELAPSPKSVFAHARCVMPLMLALKLRARSRGLGSSFTS